jgi:PhzF family phenazine biosynthesis protein
MKVKIYQIDAFTDRVFQGNPAAVCVLDRWLKEDTMQNIAAENNLAETAFVVRKGDYQEIRWFTPTLEVDLCGHATLASAYVLYKYFSHKEDVIKFVSPRSGELFVEKDGEDLILDFPADKVEKCDTPPALKDAFGSHPVESYKGQTDYLLVFSDRKEIENMKPDLIKIASVPCRGVIVTAPGKEVDFVSRFFAPQSGINEDPVTGSAHTSLAVFWSKKYAKTHLTAKQVSARGGYLTCELFGNRVKITGQAVTYLIGNIDI